MKPPIRVAMLECDTPLPKTKARYDGYGGVFEALLKAGAQDLGRPDPHSGLRISHYQVELYPERYPDLKDIDAILITGSSTVCTILVCRYLLTDTIKNTTPLTTHPGSRLWLNSLPTSSPSTAFASSVCASATRSSDEPWASRSAETRMAGSQPCTTYN